MLGDRAKWFVTSFPQLLIFSVGLVYHTSWLLRATSASSMLKADCKRLVRARCSSGRGLHNVLVEICFKCTTTRFHNVSDVPRELLFLCIAIVNSDTLLMRALCCFLVVLLIDFDNFHEHSRNVNCFSFDLQLYLFLSFTVNESFSWI